MDVTHQSLRNENTLGPFEFAKPLSGSGNRMGKNRLKAFN
jgi:hypothetical protein